MFESVSVLIPTTDSHQQDRCGEPEGDTAGPSGGPLCAAHHLSAERSHHHQYCCLAEGNVSGKESMAAICFPDM